MTEKIGIDIGSTTIKAVLLDDTNTIVHKEYMRHKSSITNALIQLLYTMKEKTTTTNLYINITGSAGMFLAKENDLSFTQEVISATTALEAEANTFDCCIELGGEDAKIIFFDNGTIEQRMNGTCAGGTGAFIDQMATLINKSPKELNDLAKDYDKIHPIASRCGVFAKSDIQPLLNQGANHTDIAASIYQAIVNQTIAGLSQGKTIKGRVAFLGGPLSFSSELRKRFIETLNLTDVFIPEDGEVFVAYGCALEATTKYNLDKFIKTIEDYRQSSKKRHTKKRLPPLFKNKEAYETFQKRHQNNSLIEADLTTYEGNMYLGIDAGSTTTKLLLLSETYDILYQYYSHNKGNPVELVRKALIDIYKKKPEKAIIKGAFSTGYGEALIKNAFNLDGSDVETICHYEAAKYFNKDVDFIIDIGGQDMKCFKVENNVITSILLNEACSSGCGSFLETFATSLGHDIKAFAKLAIHADEPVDLGSRCTVFMNSGVKQAQAENASTNDISAGLAYSVVKNALYKVIRTTDVKRDLGEQIIVQGGTFYNDGVLRAFEQEIGTTVTRPNIAGLMGAFGAAKIAMKHASKKSTILTLSELQHFSYDKKNAVCKLCNNHCQLTINIFNNKRYISGNRCEKGAGIKQSKDDIPNLYLFKYDKLMTYKQPTKNTNAPTIGLPLVLNMYENIPFWFTLFDELGFNVVYSDRSSKSLYELGQNSIPSDTACYPAKLVHGHIENLRQKDIDLIFYPNMPYNVIEKDYRDNEYNCPVVAFYPELIKANMDVLNEETFIDPYLSLNNKKYFIKDFLNCDKLKQYVSKKALKNAYDKALTAYNDYRKSIFNEGTRAIQYAQDNDIPLVLLAGRPYHIDPEVNHGIPKLIRSLDVVVLSEDAINMRANQTQVQVLNQWTYHTRLYDSAKFITTLDNAHFIQLVSFGCGLDAITGDEIKDILDKNNKLYTQIKIDEVNNLGSANIRIRSLLSSEIR
ncbi:MAG: acyl-CoA dehydratase activase [Candidatus Izimaplasma sp.]|nr:acyl-CoA dehydratase activase [Candidatus Izimaplasma bacterium]